MKKIASLSACLLILIFVAGTPANAEPGSVALEQRLKASFNTLVREVRETEKPEAKRELISAFLTRMDRGLNLAENILPASGEAGVKTASLHARVRAHRNELAAMDMRDASAGAHLDAFASYLQQDAEQAGIFLGTGALIIILIILLLVL